MSENLLHEGLRNYLLLCEAYEPFYDLRKPTHYLSYGDAPKDNYRSVQNYMLSHYFCQLCTLFLVLQKERFFYILLICIHKVFYILSLRRT